MSESLVEMTSLESDSIQDRDVLGRLGISQEDVESDKFQSKMWFEVAEFDESLEVDLPKQLQKLELQNHQLKRELERTRGQKQEELKEKSSVSNRLESLLDILPGGFVVLDRNGVVVECNPAALEFLGEPLEGEKWLTIIERCFSPQSDDGHEISLKDGRRVSMSTRSMENGEGQVILLVDQTETRNLQSNLSRNQRLTAMGQMVSALAHQVRTPLSAAMLYAGNLCKGSLSPEQNDRFAHKLMSRLNHMEQQIRDMLVFAKGDLPLTDRILVSEILEDIHQAMEVPLLSYDAECEWHFPESDAMSNKTIFCNRHALVGAVQNLVNNGIQSVVQGDKPKIAMNLSVVTEGSESHLLITVQDNGPGMSPEQLKAIENAFYSTKSDGTGLGLFVVQAIAKSHQGKFSIESELGKGTLATLTLPCAE